MRSWDLQFARENMLPDGNRQVVIATDKPVSFLAAANNTRTMDYPFTFVEMRIKPNAKGEGRLLAMTAVAFKDGRVELRATGGSRFGSRRSPRRSARSSAVRQAGAASAAPARRRVRAGESVAPDGHQVIGESA